MTRRRDLLGFAAFGAVDVARAKPKPSLVGKRRLGVLMLAERTEAMDRLERRLHEALAEFGWTDRNLTIEWRVANNDRSRLPELAAETVRSGPDAILTYFVLPTKALQLATKKIPIVTNVGDPIEYGIARSLVRPDGNVTGLSFGRLELERKRVDLLRAAVPSAKRLIIAMNANAGSDASGLAAPATSAARELGFVTEIALLSPGADMRAALRPDRISAILFGGGFYAKSSPVKSGDLIAFCLDSRLPAIVEESESVALGGLMSYEFYWENQMQRTAAQLDKVLRGVSPADIPFERPTHSWMALNLKTAKTIGIVLPQALLARADEVIE